MQQPKQDVKTPEPVTSPHLLSSQELADYLQLTEQTVRRLAKRGTIPSITVARRVRFDLKAVIHHLENTTPEREKACRDVFLSLRDTPRPAPAPTPAKL